MIVCGIRAGRYWLAMPTTIASTTPDVTAGDMIALLRQTMREKGGRLGLTLVLLIVAMVVLGILFAGNPNQIHIQERFLGPSLAHPFGNGRVVAHHPVGVEELRVLHQV